MISTITNKNNCELISTYTSKFLIDSYKDIFKIDVSHLLEKVETIDLYQCLESDYQFFTPFEISGDSSFYEQLEEFDWYYSPWKWEHQKACDYIRPNQNILEVGSGTGDFLFRLQNELGVNCTGLELNLTAIQKAKDKGVNVINERIESFAKKNAGKFDLVCMFQVLEHLTSVKEVLEACLNCLKPTGYLIVSVPNNASFIKKDKNDMLNFPPHHMGRWKESSLRKLCNYFDMSLSGLYKEPLQETHVNWYVSIQINYWVKSKFVQKVIDFVGLRKLFLKVTRMLKNKVTGHTIMAVYQK